jgi:hypothetical protein
VIRVGNAGVETPGDRRNRPITKIGYPQDMLLEVEVTS